MLELSERIKALEEEFGVSASAALAAAPAGGGGDAGEDEEESSTFDVILPRPATRRSRSSRSSARRPAWA